MPYSAKQVSDLQAERTDDPHARGYSGMTDVQFLTSVTLADIAVPRLTNTQEVFNAFVGSDLPARSSDEWQNLILLGSMNAGGEFSLTGNIFTVLDNIFNGTSTATNLAALQTEDQSPAQIAGLPEPILADVERTS